MCRALPCSRMLPGGPSHSQAPNVTILPIPRIKTPEVRRNLESGSSTSENFPSTHSGEWASLPCSKRRSFKKEVEHIVPANRAFIRPVSLWGSPTLQRRLQSLRMDPRASGGVHITRHHLGMAARARCGGRNVCLAGDLCARLSLRRLTHLQRRVTIDGYTNLISLLSFLILMIRVLVKLSVLPGARADDA